MRYVCFYKILIVTLFPLLLQGMETLQEYHVRCALKELGISPFLKKKRYKVKKKEGDQPEEWQHMVDMLMSNDNTTNNDDDSADNNDAEGNQSLS